MKNLLRNQEGALGMILVIGFMALAVPLITASLFLSGALSRDSQVKTDILKRQYAALGVGEYVNYLVSTPALWGTWKSNNETQSPGTYEEIITINGQDTTFTASSLANPPGIPPVPNPSVLQTQLSVNSDSVSGEGTVTFTITVINQGTDLEELTKVFDGLPPGFTYVPGSTSGATTLDPTSTTMGDQLSEHPYSLLTWDLTPLNLASQPGESINFSFQATAPSDNGNFCNRAWSGPAGGDPGSGVTSLITVNDDSDDEGSEDDASGDGASQDDASEDDNSDDNDSGDRDSNDDSGSEDNDSDDSDGDISDPCVDSRLLVTTVVDRQVVHGVGGATQLFTYTTTLDNVGSETQVLTGLQIVLPLDFTPKSLSTSGDLGTDNPVTTLLTSGRWLLDWTLASPIQVLGGTTKTHIFQAEAQIGVKNYSSESYAKLDDYGIKVEKNVTIQGDLVSSVSKVKVKKDVVISGGIRSAGKVDVDKDSTIQGDIVATADIKLKKDTTVQGNVTSSGQVELQQGANVTGTTQEQASGLTIVPADLLSPATLATGNKDIEVGKNDSLALSPGSYAKLDVDDGGTITLSSGQYSFTEVEVDKNSTINLDLTNGALTVDVAKKLKLKQNVQMVIVSQVGSASDVTFRAMKGIDLRKDGRFIGTFLALGGEEYGAFSWPTATVRGMEVFQVSTTNANGEIGSFEAWVGTDSGLINRPIVDR